MSEHVHIGVLTAGVTFLTLIPIFALVRYLEYRYHDHPLAKAMAFIY